MIHLEKQFGEYKVATLLEFGNGDIAVMPTDNIEDTDSFAVMFKSTNLKMELNVDIPGFAKGQTSDDIQPEVIMVFNNTKSIDTVIWALNKVKRKLLKKQL